MKLLRRFGNYLLKSDSYASAAVLIFSTLDYLGLATGFLALIILGLVTLIKGPRSGAAVLAWAILPPLCMLYLHQWAYLDLVGLLRCVLICGLALVFRAGASWRLVLELEALVGVVIVSGFHLFIPDVSSWWIRFLRAYFEKIELHQQLNVSVDQLQQFVQQVAPYATGLVVVGALIGVFILLILARWWQKSLVFSSASFSSEFATIRMSPWDAGVILMALLGCLFREEALLMDLLPVLIFPFVVAGFSVLHYGANRKKPENLLGRNLLNQILKMVLVFSYLALVFIPWLVGGMIALVGVLDSGFDIRQKIFDRKRVKV